MPVLDYGAARCLSSERVAELLEEIAELLEAQDANPFRVRAYRFAADTVRSLPRPVSDVVEHEGPEGLRRIHGIGESLSRSIEQLARTGHLGLLDRLRGEFRSPQVLATVPGLGPKLAERIHIELDIDGLHDLEIAAYDGRLARVHGMGRERIRAVRESLAGRFHRRPPRPESGAGTDATSQPAVAELLDIDREYRRKAKVGILPRISPRRFNPTQKAWLPILHTERRKRHYTALYSNTARAHEFGTTRDWVVIYRDDDGGLGQWTVVTARLGALRGRRVVRGREDQCRQHYRRQAGKAATAP
jgi:putative hydrolase